MFCIYDKIKNNETYIIAEMSANHAGDINNALEIVKKAVEAGADCVKIQTYTADTLTIDSDKDDFKIKGGLWDGYTMYQLYSEAYTPWEWQKRIKEECERYNVDFLSTPFDKTAVDFLEGIGIEAYKIASYELVDIPLIEYTASKMKTMIMSCGMASEEEIDDAVNACIRVGNNNIVLLKCCSEYPAVKEDMNLSLIKVMSEKYSLPVGLSDHSEGYLVDQLAVASGACVIEKHVCLSKDIKNPDSEFSMEMKDFAEMVKAVKDVEKIMGTGEFRLTAKEEAGKSGRRSLYIVKDVKKGEIYTEENIRSIRPSYGLPPRHMNEILGKKATNDFEKGTALSWEMIE